MHEPIRRILVGLGTNRTASSVTAHAIDIARDRGAELVGVAVTDPVRLEWTGPRPMGVGVEVAAADLRTNRYERARADIAAAAARRLEKSAAYFAAHGRAVDTDHAPGDPAKCLVPYATDWGADLIVAGNSAKNRIMRKLFGETALQLLRGSPLPLYLAQ